MKNPFKQRGGERVELKVGDESEAKIEAEVEAEKITESEQVSGQIVPPTIQDGPSVGQNLTFTGRTSISSATPEGLHPRKKKYATFCLAIGLALSPILLAAASCVADPAAWPFFKAAFFDKKYEDRLADYSRAYEISHDAPILLKRAKTYREKDATKKITDLQKLIAEGSRDSDVYQMLARTLLTQPGNRDKAVALYKKSIDLLLQRPKFGRFDDINRDYALYSANNELLALGQAQTVKDFCLTVPPDQRPSPNHVNLLLGLAERETTGGIVYKHFLLQAATDRPLAPSRINSEAYYYLALGELDSGNTSGAREYLAKGASFNGIHQAVWLRDLTAAWIDYSEERYGSALERLNDLNHGKTRYDSDFPYLRARIYEKLGNKQKSLEAMEKYRKYKNIGYDGYIYIPKKFRPEK